MKQGLLIGLAWWLGTLTAFGQQAPVRPTLDREVEGKAQKALQPPPKVQAPGSEAAAEPADANDELKIDFLYGVVILTDRALLKVEGVPRGKPVQVPESDPLLNSKEFKELILRHCQKPMSTRLMNQLLHEIIQFYHAHGHMLVDVLYEPQDISNGMLQITVLEGKLKQIKLQDKEGRPYTNGLSNPAQLKSSLHLKEDQPVLRPDVYADLDWLNRNPFRKVQPVFEPGGGFAQSDLLLRIEERRPIEFLAGYDNAGSETTGENRIFAGLTWGKAFGIQDHIFNYQFTATPDFEGLRAHVASYTMLLPWRHALRFFGSYLNTEGDVEGNHLKGKSYQASMRYDVPLPVLGELRHEVSGGIDYKYNENDLLFGGNQTQNTPTEIFQLLASYTAGLADRWGQSALAAQVVYSPGNVTPKNDDPHFEAARAFADSTYGYGRLTAERETRLWRLLDTPPDESGQSLRWNIRGMFQLASGNLLPSEQFGVGGYATVRGYAEREVNLDEGWLISNELRSPAFSPAKWVGLSKVDDRLEVLGFWDYAVGWNKHRVTIGQPEPSSTTLTSVGPGLRYGIGRYLAFRFDYGFPLKQNNTDPTNHDDPRAHFGVSISY